MWKRLLLGSVLSLLAATAQATILTGTVRGPSGNPVSGRLMFRLQRFALNTCVTPSRQASLLPSYINVVNGSLTGSVDIVPSDCLTPFQTYYVEMRTGTTLLMVGQYYVTQVSGAVLSPATGSNQFTLAGLSLSAQSNSVLFLLVNPGGGFKTKSVATGTVSAGGNLNVVATWPIAFTSATYTASCSVIDTSTPTVPLVYATTITAKTARSVTATVHNADGSGRAGTLICVGRT